MVQTGERVALAFGLTIAAGAATMIGGAVVYSKRMVELANPKSLAVALSVSCGVMLFISLVEIFNKSVEKFSEGLQSDGECDDTCNGHSWLLATVMFLVGVGFIYAIDVLVHKMDPHHDHGNLNEELDELRNSFNVQQDQTGYTVTKTPAEGDLERQPAQPVQKDLMDDKVKLQRTGVMASLAIGIHNLPEGIATYVAAIDSTRFGVTLAIGIALHNIPEGVAVSTPIYFATGSRWKGFLWSIIAALAEPLGGLLAWLAIGEDMDASVEGIMFGIVTGMMVAICLKELLPAARQFAPEGNLVSIGLFGGMLLMAMSLIFFAYAGA